MANEEHLSKILEGIDAWNLWRTENPDLVPDLSEAELDEEDLSYSNLSNANLLGIDLGAANLYKADLSHSVLDEANFCEANLEEADLSFASLVDSNFDAANLTRANLFGADFCGVEANGSNFSYANLVEAFFIEAYLHRANFFKADLSRTDFSRADLRDANFCDANMLETILNDADCTGVKLIDATGEAKNLIREQLQYTVADKMFNMPSYLISDGVDPEALFESLRKFSTSSVMEKSTLNEEWQKRPDDQSIESADERERGWLQYAAFLKAQVDRPIALASFSLWQIYVPLRAFYISPLLLQRSDKNYRYNEVMKKLQKEVVDPITELEAWLKYGKSHESIRVISGTPGSGKSSFAKIFAIQISEYSPFKVLFIPLHRFDFTGNLIDAVGSFVRFENIFTHSPLDLSNPEAKLLLIFDGLDNLQRGGKIGRRVVEKFTQEIRRVVDIFNSNPDYKINLKVLLTGCELIVQECAEAFHHPKQILHLLPYFVEDKQRKEYEDPLNLLQADQRKCWWIKYGEVMGIDYAGLPEGLAIDSLTPITVQPLHNYLLALTHLTTPLVLAKQSNFNIVYELLLTTVYEQEQLEANREVQTDLKDRFIRLLEEIGLAAWHSHGMTVTVEEIETACKNNGLEDYLKELMANSEVSISRLLTFNLRQSSMQAAEEKTFELTHESFGEYLTARRIVREIRLIHQQLEERERKSEKGWDTQECLKRWAILCGLSAMDYYLYKFVINEVQLQNTKEVAQWQRTLCRLIESMLLHGMPMEQVRFNAQTFQEMKRQACNAEEALLAVLSACALATREISKIHWPSADAAGKWLSRLEEERQICRANTICWQCFVQLDLSKQLLTLKDFSNSNLSDANLSGADLSGTDLCRVNLSNANLRLAYLRNSNLIEADLKNADLFGADLRGSDLRGADLSGVDLRGTDLRGTDLSGANLTRAYLSGTNLEEVNLSEANLEETKLKKARLKQANLRGANLSKADLSKADLRGCKNLSADQIRLAIYSGKTKFDEELLKQLSESS
jgi:uncharacterized protein YjbI with pentapeptide repeats